jgi:hypothetical protein
MISEWTAISACRGMSGWLSGLLERPDNMPEQAGGVTYAQIVDKLYAIGVVEKEVNIRNKLAGVNFQQRFKFNVLPQLAARAWHWNRHRHFNPACA